MAVESREVRRLVLHSRREHVRRTAFLVEDGLRTATLAGSERALIVVRSLALGCVDPRDPPAALSRRIEEKWNEAERIAVPAVRPEANHATAVRFESKEQAFAIYLGERLAGGVPDAWYWKRVLPPRAEELPTGDLFTALALALAEPSEGAAARVVAFLEHIERCGALPLLVEAIDDRHAAPVLTVLLPGVSLESLAAGPVLPEQTRPAPDTPAAPQAATDSGTRLHGEIQIAAPFRAVLRSVARRFSHSRTAAVFATVAILRERPWLAPSPEALARRVRAVLAQACAPDHLSPAEHPPDIHEAPLTASPTGPDQLLRQRHAPSEPMQSQRAAPASAFPARALSEQPHPNPGERRQPLPADGPQRGELSLFAGLFFLLPVTERLGFDDFAAEHPALFEAGLLPALLYELACSAGAAQDDPVLSALGYTPPDEPVPEFLAAIADWRRRVNRYVRREGKLLVRWVVRRRGYVVFTRTHIDVYFDLAQAGVRLRRLGLDIDPGWVPALGKVIAYRYGCDVS